MSSLVYGYNKMSAVNGLNVIRNTRPVWNVCHETACLATVREVQVAEQTVHIIYD